MAFLGSFGKYVLGGASTGDVVSTVTGSKVAGQVAQGAANFISSQNSGGTQQGQSVAVSQATQTTPAETQSSGTNAGAQNIVIGYSDMGGGGFENVYSGSTPQMRAQNVGLPAIIAGGVGMSRGLAGMLFGGAVGAAPMIIDAFTGEPKRLRVTRKLQRDVKNAVTLLGPETVANQLGVGLDVVVYILQKKIRNDGPFVTKAAVRKTRQTVRKMRTMCDLYDDLRPAAKRRAPVKRMAATRITNVK
tara:strand:- start:97 stop:834 length:738 start_codon:yes stop_codon:yes gene_type:complete